MTKVFVSVPAFNEPQYAGAERIIAILEKAGIEILPKMAPEEPKLLDRLAFISQADLVLLWTDGLLPDGVSLCAICNVQKKLDLPFPPPIFQLINAGMAATGQSVGSLSGKKQSILLPGQIEQQNDVPKGMSIVLPDNVGICQILSPPQNIPATLVLFEAGYAAALGKKLTALQIGPSPGLYFSEEDGVEILKSFDELEKWAQTASGNTREEKSGDVVSSVPK